ncbi:unnamed protein product [Strongylus vulgaris]|uniref:Uncharacterized protein n=1 Tax=Strongylus vulgaris TaxID=40348 RepID=A0A3P7J7E7_STRVU|nr:unnamed protein product [Strongylus vulgaris]
MDCGSVFFLEIHLDYALIVAFQTYHTCDLCSLAVGDNVVWALDSSGQLLRLRGLAAGNPAGNYWRPISQAVFR